MTHNPSLSSVSVPTPNAPQAHQQPYGSMGQVGSGPAAELYTLANQLMALYNEMEALYNEMTQLEVNTQSQTLQASAQAQRDAAKWQALAIGAQAAGTLLGAVATGATMHMENTQNKDNIDNLNKEQPKLDSLNNLEKSTRIATNNPTSGNALPDDQPPVAEDQPARIRARQLLQRNYEPAPGLDEKGVQADYNKAYNAMSVKERIQFRNNLHDDINGQEKVVNTAMSKIQTTQTTIQQKSQLLNAGANLIGQAGQATFTGIQGNSQAGQQIASGVSQMASGTAETTRQNIGKFYDMCASLISAARQGAQAYAQT